ncbi:gastrula zinc finger protein XlCGF57.1-like [Thalassophryne amazonica]|uniref:gastrula zinc finger protein XlCGF57.1-like n=1 Tax=Thalassophryne amazonica TaxID=390379 RepID=UPI00147184A2|nr:gastrula zinc finger protein XlCGF57.1-like [Thalassophryne amazonica]
MSKVQILRALLKQRLSADEEIFELFERTAAEYEEELCGLKEENERQRKLLDAVSNSNDKADVQQCFVEEELASNEQQEGISHVDPDICHIKKEEGELLTSNEQKHFQVLEVDATMCSKIAVNSPSSHCHQLQNEDNTEAEPLVSSSAELMKTNDNGENGRGSELVGRLAQDDYSCPQSAMISCSSKLENVIDVDWNETEELDPCLNSLKNKIICDRKCNAAVKPLGCENDQNIGHKCNLVKHNGNDIGHEHLSCSPCGQTFWQTSHPINHVLIHTGEKPFHCFQCGKAFTRKSSLKTHMIIHTANKPCCCSYCGKTFSQNSHFKIHMMCHTGEKSFSCSECGNVFSRNGSLKKHMKTHAGNKPFNCSECGETFKRNSHLRSHMLIHTGEKPFRCTECGKTFNRNSNLKAHMIIHTGKKAFNCSECGKAFGLKGNLKNHMTSHTGEKPFSCIDCGKTFSQNCHLQTHMIVHAREKPFSCSECGKTFSQTSHVKAHMITHSGERPFTCSECGKTFKRRNTLKTHLIIHTRKIKPFIVLSVEKNLA